MSKPLEELARQATEQLQDCYEYHKAGPNFDYEAGEKIVLHALETAVGEIQAENERLELMAAEGALKLQARTEQLEQARKDGETKERRMLMNAHAQFARGTRAWKGRELWAFVIDVIGTGSTVACETCRKHGWNPHQDAFERIEVKP